MKQMYSIEELEAAIADYMEKHPASNVIANPTLAGTEEALEGIEIDGTKYSVSQGGKLHKHHVVMSCLDSCSASVTIDVIFYTSSSTPLTAETFKAMFTLATNGDYKMLNEPHIANNRSFTTPVNNALGYDSTGDEFYDSSYIYSLVELTDSVN